MTSKHLFSKAASLDRRRDVPWTAIYLIIFFFALPVAYLFTLGNVTLAGSGNAMYFFHGNRVMGEEYAAYIRHARTILMMGFPTVAMTIFGCAEAYHHFGFLHRKREVDFYHGLPQSRKSLFWTKILNAVLSVVFAYTVMDVAGLLCTKLSPVKMGDIIAPWLVAYGLNVLAFFLSFAVASLAVILTGKALTGILGMAVLFGYFPLLDAVIESIPGAWSDTYVSGDRWRPLMEISPVSQIAHLWSRFSDMQNRTIIMQAPNIKLAFIIRIAICVVVIIALLIISNLLYKKRKLERAGEAMAFQKSERAVRILLTVFAALAGMQFMKALDRGLLWTIFGTLCAIILTHMLIELIFRADGRRVLKHWVELIIMSILGVALVLAMNYDVFKIDSYVPKKESIESVKIDIQTANDATEIHASNGDLQHFYAAVKDNEHDWFGGTFESNKVLEREEEIDIALELARLGVEKNTEIYSDETITYDMQYALKGGRTVCRTYTVLKKDIKNVYGKLLERTSYKENVYPFVYTNIKPLAVAYEEMDAVAEISKADSDELVAAYKKDIDEMTMSSRGEAYPIGLLNFALDKEDASKYVNAGTNLGTGAREVTYFCVYPVYPSFENTIACLKKNDIDVGKLNKDIASAQSITISYNVFDDEKTTSFCCFDDDVFSWRKC